MTYQSEKHKEVFDKAMVKKNENNYKLIAVIYLLTADNTLWNLAKNAVKKNAVDFDAIKLNAIHPKGYTLYLTEIVALYLLQCLTQVQQCVWPEVIRNMNSHTLAKNYQT